MTQNNAPKEVYEYFNKKYESAFAEGNFYINTFGNIRSREDGIIFDNKEGIVENVCKNIEIKDSNDPKNKGIVDFFGDNGIKLEGNCELKITNSSFINTLDAYIYCVTSERKDDYWENIPEDQGGPYDRCIKITNFSEFAIKLRCQLNKLNKNIIDSYINEIFCESNQGIIENNTIKSLNYFRKPISQSVINNFDFKHQKEWRIVLLSSNHNYSPTLCKVPPRKIEQVNEGKNLVGIYVY